MESMSTGMIMIAFVALLVLITAVSQFIWGERGMMIAIGIILAVLGIIVVAIGIQIAYAYIFNYPVT